MKSANLQIYLQSLWWPGLTKISKNHTRPKIRSWSHVGKHIRILELIVIYLIIIVVGRTHFVILVMGVCVVQISRFRDFWEVWFFIRFGPGWGLASFWLNSKFGFINGFKLIWISTSIHEPQNWSLFIKLSISLNRGSLNRGSLNRFLGVLDCIWVQFNT